MLKRTQYIIFLLLALTFFVACEKDDSTPEDNPDNPTPVDTIPEGPNFDVPETSDVIMYEVNLRAFSQSGDLQGVIARMDELESLSVNAIWLMPIFPVGTINSVNSPYCIKNFKVVGAEYGTLDDLKALTAEAHDRGIAVLLDWVANHTAWDNPWIYDHPDWYSQDGSGNIIIPPGTNWEDVADLNYDNQNMRLAMIDAMKYWVLQADVDGFRCDYADGVPFDFWKQAIDSIKAIPDREYLFLAEGSRSDHFAAGFDMTFGWDFYATMKNVYGGQAATTIYNTHQDVYENIPATKQRLRFTTNHDESAWDATPMVLFDGEQGALAASAVTTYMGGVPLIYTGQEVGTVANTPFFSNSPINWNNNPEMLDAYKEMMSFYASSDAAKKGSITDYSNFNVVCFVKKSGDKEVLVIANMRNESKTMEFPPALQNSEWTGAFSEAPVTLGSQMNLNAYEYKILYR